LDRLPLPQLARYFGGDVELVAPRWLGIMVVIPFVALVSVFSLTDLSWPQRALSVLIRSVLIVAIAVALARPSQVAIEKRVATVFCVDVSESISDKQLQRSHDYVEKAWK